MQVGNAANVNSKDRDAVKAAFLAMERQIAGELGQEIDKIAPTKLPSTLFHYTNAAGLEGIVSSGAIYLTDAFYLNDKTELSYTRDLVAQIVKERATSIAPSLHRFFAQRLTGFDPFASNDINFACYIASFCERSDLLSQWRTYGAGANGYALALAVGECADPAMLATTGLPPAALIPVVYD